MRNAGTIATWVTLLATVIGGSIWVGAVANEVTNTKVAVVANTVQIDKIRDQVPADIASMKTKIESIEGKVQDIKDSQEELLKEIRKK